MADLTVLHDAINAYCASMNDGEWSAFASSVREPVGVNQDQPIPAAPSVPSPVDKKIAAAAAMRQMRKGA